MNSVGRQCVILAGGRGTRLGSLVDDLPKPILPVDGRPFLEHLVCEIRRFGFDRFVFLAGYRGERVAAHFKDGGPLSHRLEAQFTTLIEREPLGTAGALQLAASGLEDFFLLMNGDSFFDFNILDLAARPLRDSAVARIALRKVGDVSRYGVVETNDDLVTSFRAQGGREGSGLVNAGIYWLSKRILDHLPVAGGSLESEVFPKLAKAGRLLGAAYQGYFVDIGIPDDYDTACRELTAALRRPAVFFDRDNVLNEDAGYTHSPNGFKWIEGAQAAIKTCNDSGAFVFVVSNQAGVARGLYDIAAVENLHTWMNEELRRHGAHVDAFRFCPHHPLGTVAAYAMECACRKPQPGMILDLLKAWPVVKENSVLIGDKTSDIAAGEAAGITSCRFMGGNLEHFVAAIPRLRVSSSVRTDTL
jgi:D-glycero-D-manno-heptose 1,7-bisphosphate phosphatase